MKETNDADGLVNRRSVVKGLGAGAVGLAGLSAPVSADEDEEDADGENIYLVFGADTSDSDLDSWLDDHREEMADGNAGVPYLQYEDVTQVNVTLQGLAVAIAIDGGSAEAIQKTFQQNENFQSDSDDWSMSEDETKKEKKFKNASNVYVLFADETEGHQFSGWAVDSQTYEPDYDHDTDIEQQQDVDQVNFSFQGAAISVAECGSDAHAYQRSYQENNNLQAALTSGHCDGKSDSQYQDVTQLNASLQGIAVAIAVGKHSEATAWQATCQFNRNAQIQDDNPVFDPMSVKEVAASAEMSGDYSDMEMEWKDDDHKKDDDRKHEYSQRNRRGRAEDITQFQDVLQLNINVQLLALAIGVGGCDATATQASYQGNFNAQILELYKKCPKCDKKYKKTKEKCPKCDKKNKKHIETGHAGLLAVQEGEKMKDGRWGAAYEGGDGSSLGDITQAQIVQQLNVNAQLLAIAVAIKDDATAEQLSFQANQNAQVLRKYTKCRKCGEKYKKEKKKCPKCGKKNDEDEKVLVGCGGD